MQRSSQNTTRAPFLESGGSFSSRDQRWILEDTTSVKNIWRVLTQKLFLTRFGAFWHAELSYRLSFCVFWHVLTRFDTIWHVIWHVLTRFDTFRHVFWHILTRRQLFLTRDFFWHYLTRFDTIQKPVVFFHFIHVWHFLTRLTHVWHVLHSFRRLLRHRKDPETAVGMFFWHF